MDIRTSICYNFESHRSPTWFAPTGNISKRATTWRDKRSTLTQLCLRRLRPYQIKYSLG